MNNDLLDLSFFNDEAWFHFQGYLCEFTKCADVECRKSHYFYQESQLHPKKIGAWVAISRRRLDFSLMCLSIEEFRQNVRVFYQNLSLSIRKYESPSNVCRRPRFTAIVNFTKNYKYIFP
jgi:hypothetical protein